MTDEAPQSEAPTEAQAAGHPSLAPVAEAALQMVVSRELVHDARSLMKIGPGLYEMELLTGTCRQGFRYHPTLAIAQFARARMLAAIRSMELDWAIVTQARLSLKVTLEEKDPAKGYKPLMLLGRYEGIYVLCRTEAVVSIATVNGSWTANGRGAIDWPRDWGNLGL
ncbi:MAG TPA: hypothetical protein VLD58_09900 [Gemmatimonadales bacterium]|nr:hypothetical protein [Gemmatimonadales bacterium]